MRTKLSREGGEGTGLRSQGEWVAELNSNLPLPELADTFLQTGLQHNR